MIERADSSEVARQTPSLSAFVDDELSIRNGFSLPMENGGKQLDDDPPVQAGSRAPSDGRPASQRTYRIAFDRCREMLDRS
jgi:hypothetical protein